MKNLRISLSEEEVYSLIGLAGVSRHESYQARCWGRFFVFLMVLAAIVLLLQWQWLILGDLTLRSKLLLNWLVWLVFIFIFTIELIVVKHKRRYLVQNWFLPVIITMGTPFLLGYAHYMHIFDGLRPVLALIILVPSFSTFFKFLIDGKLRTTLLAAFVIVIISGLLIAGIDPNIKTPWDGIWWSLATVSTVGYGDVVPTSALGRLLGSGLVVIGLALFVIITANILALILHKEVEQKEGKVDDHIKQLEQNVSKILKNQATLMELNQVISKRMDDLERDK